MGGIYFSLIIIAIMLFQGFKMIEALNFVSFLMIIYNIFLMLYFLALITLMNWIASKTKSMNIGILAISAIDQFWIMLVGLTSILGTFLVYQSTYKEYYDLEKLIFGLVCWTFPLIFSKRLVYIQYHPSNFGEKK